MHQTSPPLVIQTRSEAHLSVFEFVQNLKEGGIFVGLRIPRMLLPNRNMSCGVMLV